MKRLRVGAVSYLNTKPLIGHLPRLAPEVDLVLEVPSRIARDLASGQLDIGLIPSIEYFRSGRYTILPGVSIASYGPVMSVRLHSRVPFAEIRTLALDEGSRTSIALADILLHHLFDCHPQTEALPLRTELANAKTDAVLLIGDRAMRVLDGEFPFTLDLGYEWSRWTGLPFVFAFWAVAEGVEVSKGTQAAFIRAKELGRPDIPQIAEREAARLGLDPVRCRYYLEHVIRHDLGPEEMAGLERFARLAAERGLAPEGVACVLHGRDHFAKSR